MITPEEYRSLKPGVLIYYSYVPYNRKRPITITYPLIAVDPPDDRGKLKAGSKYVVNIFSMGDPALSLTPPESRKKRTAAKEE